MLTYRLQHSGSPLAAFGEFEVNSEALPRVGDTITVSGTDYDVIAVWHVVVAGPPGECIEFVVRVRGGG